jgi:hypothetical protein
MWIAIASLGVSLCSALAPLCGLTLRKKNQTRQIRTMSFMTFILAVFGEEIQVDMFIAQSPRQDRRLQRSIFATKAKSRGPQSLPKAGA